LKQARSKTETTAHRHIPVLPECPVSRSFVTHITRSYPVGRMHYSRAVQGKSLFLSIAADKPFPPAITANLVTTINAVADKKWNRVPFRLESKRLLTCSIIPEQTGVHSFRVEFSVNGGESWIRDNVPDALVVVDPPQAD